MKAFNFYAVAIFSVVLLFTSVCQGRGHSLVKKVENKSLEENHAAKTIGVIGEGVPRTFSDDDEEKNEWWRISDPDKLDKMEYGLTSLVIWPVLLLILGILVIPTTLVIVVAFVIPIIAPDEGGTGRMLPSSNNHLWMPIYLAQEVYKGYESECIERISCEITKAASKSGYPLTNWLHRQLRNSTVLSSSLQSRISRSIALADQKSSKCYEYECLPLGSSGNDRIRRSLDFSGMFEPSYIYDWFVKYWGGRYIYVRKLAANKDVDFFPPRKTG